MEEAAGPLMKRRGCPVLSALPLIWAAAPDAPLTFPYFLPQLPQQRMRQGVSTPFWKVQKVNEGKARNSIQWDELLGREEPGSGLRAKGGVGDGTYGHGA